jgi:Sec-independent protein secretion pathway component TatC
MGADLFFLFICIMFLAICFSLLIVAGYEIYRLRKTNGEKLFGVGILEALKESLMIPIYITRDIKNAITFLYKNPKEIFKTLLIAITILFCVFLVFGFLIYIFAWDLMSTHEAGQVRCGSLTRAPNYVNIFILILCLLSIRLAAGPSIKPILHLIILGCLIIFLGATGHMVIEAFELHMETPRQ